MPRTKTPSFVLELPMKVDSKQARELTARFNAGYRLYLACLNEAKKRLDASIQHPQWAVAKAMPSTVKAAKKGERKANLEKSDLFKAIHDETGWSEYAMHSFATHTANASKWIADKVDSNTQQQLATRAFKATEKLLFGNARSIRFKPFHQFRSMEGKSNKQGIRFKDDQLIWGNLTCDLLIDWDNPYHQHGLKSSIKHCRVIRREQKGKTKWFMQLVCKGLPYANPDHPVSNGTVGIDLNISNLAVVGDDYAALLPFTEGVKPIAKRISALQRKMSRSERIANPDNFEPDFEAV